jgi:hypothetical protein
MRRALLSLALVLGASTAGAQDVAVQRGVRVQPESVTVGDPFRVVVRIRAPKGTVLEFPQGPDTTTGVEALDRVVITPGTDTTVVDHVATYRLAAWDVGRLPIRFDDVLLRSGGRERRVAVGGLAIEVTSVLPADSALRVPKPVRPVYEFGVPWWYWLIVALLAAAIGALLWWWWRRRRDPAALRRDPYEEAMHAFDHADSLGLLAAGEAGHHLALAAEILRVYLSRVVPAARIAHTTSELALALRGDPVVPLPRLARVLHDIDLVKFAQHPVTEARAQDLAAEARAIVVTVHDAVQAAQVAKAA